MIEAVSGLLPRPSASFIMRSHHWRGTRVISRRSAEHEGQAGRILFRGRARGLRADESGKNLLPEGGGIRWKRTAGAIKYPAKLQVFPGPRVRLSWKHMDTLYGTLLHTRAL